MRMGWLGLGMGILCWGSLLGCASAPPVQVVQAGDGVPLSVSLLDAAQKELTLALSSYDAGDYAGSEQAAVRASRILYAAAPPDNGEGRRYAELTSKLGLLTVRLNRFLHDVSPELEPERFSLPIPYNSRIERELDYYMLRGREPFARWLRRSGRYVPVLQEYFVEAGLPPELVYLALVESGFNPRNRSDKEAVGLFQFIESTAEMVGLESDSWRDERRHPQKATRAAIQHLKSLYKTFQDWDLAMAAYNAGASRIKKAMKDQGASDYWQLALPLETEAYVPKFYATLIIAKEPELYGFNPEFEEEQDGEDVEIPGGVDFSVIAECIGATTQAIADMNTELTKGCTPPGPDTYRLHLPRGSGERFAAAFSALPEERKFLSADEISRRKFKGVYFMYKVKSGESLYTIARKHHTTVAKLLKWNDNARKSKYIFPGQKLRVYRMH